MGHSSLTTVPATLALLPLLTPKLAPTGVAGRVGAAKVAGAVVTEVTDVGATGMADKNLGPVIVTKTWYDKEVSRLLSDDLFYRKIDIVPFTSMKRVLLSILDRHGRLLGDKLKSYILQYADVHDPANFKILPKVHKCPLVGRPIVASTKYVTTPASRFIDYTCPLCLLILRTPLI